MPLPLHIRYLVEQTLQAYCEKRVPSRRRKEVKAGFAIRGKSVTLFEDRRHFIEKSRWIPIPIAQFRFDLKSAIWRLYRPDRNSRWHVYFLASPSRRIEDLIRDIEENAIGTFLT